MAQWIGHQPAPEGVTGLIPDQGSCLGCRPGTCWGACKRQPLMFLFLSFSLPSPLSKNKQNILKKGIRNKVVAYM